MPQSRGGLPPGRARGACRRGSSAPGLPGGRSGASWPRRAKRLATLVAALAGLLAVRGAGAQCLLANPSFEIAGSGGSRFGGWQQFGSVGSSTSAVHGTVGARVSGPNTGGWDVSGYWQQLDAAPGDRWAASVFVSHASAHPLAGQSRAIVNIEWRDAGGSLISYESHTAADASTPPGEFHAFSVESQPAPAGTAAARLLLGVLQAPSDPVPDVIYDQATFDRLSTPSLDERQWFDFPGGRTIRFGGRDWRVKGPGFYEPGPSAFSDDSGNIWVDADGRLHLTIRRIGGTWYSTEAALEAALGYGDYVFTTRGRLDTLDPRAVLGLFVWQYGPCYDPATLWWNPFNEIDVEFSRWGNPGNPGAQFVAQPFNYPGNLNAFAATFADGEVASHAFRWLPDRVEFRSWRGGPGEEATAIPIHAWTYTGPHVPRPDQPRVHVNLWQFEGPPAASQEVVLDAFTFVPACVAPPCGVVAVAPQGRDATVWIGARPNPFRRSTAIRYAATGHGPVDLAVYDLAGRRLRTLVEGRSSPGEHEIAWDGRDGTGRRLPTGVYLLRFRGEAESGTRRVVLLR